MVKTGVYLGSPAIVLLPDSSYLATHDIFGKVGGMGFDTFVYRSNDRGATWRRTSTLPRQRCSSLHAAKPSALPWRCAQQESGNRV